MKVGALAALAGGAFVAKFMGDAIAEASDLNETTTKTEAIFGRASKAVQDFAGQGAMALGQSKVEVLDAASTFGTFGKAAGLGGKDLAKFSTDFVSLSTDLASFNNSTPEEAVQAIGAALRGESEPIRSFGVLLDDATLRNEALRLGLIKTTKEALTPQQKVLAAQAAIYKQTSDAQGDFEKTSGGLANQQRILAAQWKDLKATLGQALLPAAVSFITAINGFIPKLQQVGTFIAPVVNGIRNLVAGFKSLGGSGGGLGAGVLAALAPIKTALGTVVGAFRGLVGAVAPIVAQVVNVIRSNWGPISGYVRTTFGAIRSIITSVMSIVATAVRNATTVIRAVWSNFGGDILKIATTFFRAVANIVQGVLRVIAGIFKTVSAAIRGDWSGAWQGIRQIAAGATQAIVGLVRGAFGILRTIAAAAMREFLQAVRGGFENAVAIARNLPGLIKGALGNLGSLLYSAGASLIQGLINGISSKIASVKAKISEVAGAVGRFFPGSPVKEGPLKSWNNGGAGLRLMEMTAEGVRKGGKKLRDVLTRELQQAETKLDRIKGKASTLTDAVKSSLEVGDLFGAGAAGLAGTLSSRLANAQGMLAALNAASKKGLDGGLYAEIAKSGDTATAQEIAAMSAAEIAALENLYNATTASIAKVADTAKADQYGEQLKEQNRMIRELEKVLKKLPKEVRDGAEDGTHKGNADKDKNANQRARAGR